MFQKIKLIQQKEGTQGFTLVEIAVAISVIAVGLVSAFAVFSTILRVTGLASERFTAFYLAQEGAEILINIRDTNLIKISRGDSVEWDDGIGAAFCGNGCYVAYEHSGTAPYITETDPGKLHKSNIITAPVYSYEEGEDSVYSRTIITQEIDEETLKADITVSWEHAGISREFTLQKFIHKWHEEIK